MCHGRSLAQHHVVVRSREAVRSARFEIWRERNRHWRQRVRVYSGIRLLRLLHLLLFISGTVFPSNLSSNYVVSSDRFTSCTPLITSNWYLYSKSTVNLHQLKLHVGVSWKWFVLKKKETISDRWTDVELVRGRYYGQLWLFNTRFIDPRRSSLGRVHSHLGWIRSKRHVINQFGVSLFVFLFVCLFVCFWSISSKILHCVFAIAAARFTTRKCSTCWRTWTRRWVSEISVHIDWPIKN